jgi:hypothetical protein
VQQKKVFSKPFFSDFTEEKKSSRRKNEGFQIPINLVSIFRYSSSSSNPVYARYVDLSSSGFSLSSYRQS